MVATVTAVIVVGLAAEWAAAASHGPAVRLWGSGFAFVGAWAVLFSCASATLSALPLVALNRRGRAISLSLAITWGAVLGAAPFVLLGVVAAAFALADHEGSRLTGVGQLLLPFLVAGALCGVFAGASFYFVVTRSGPPRAGAT
jgi:hypothetical protein